MKCASAVAFRNFFLWKAALNLDSNGSTGGQSEAFLLMSRRWCYSTSFWLPFPRCPRSTLGLAASFAGTGGGCAATSTIPAWCHVGSRGVGLPQPFLPVLWLQNCLCLALRTCRFLPAGGLVLPKFSISRERPAAYSPDSLFPDSSKWGWYTASSEVLPTHFRMRTWVDPPGVLVFCAEALLVGSGCPVSCK